MSILYGFHAVQARIKQAPGSVQRVLVDEHRNDPRMQQLIKRVQQAGLLLEAVPAKRLEELAGHRQHQGVVAMVEAVQLANSLAEILEALQNPPASAAINSSASAFAPLFLVLDGITDPHNLGACLRTADAAGVHAVVVPKDNSAPITPVVAKVACGAADTVPVIVVNNLARALESLQDAGVWCVGAAGEAEHSLYHSPYASSKQRHWHGPLAWVLGAEGTGLRRLTREHCDELVNIPMLGSVESLNVSVATAVCLYETLRLRGQP